MKFFKKRYVFSFYNKPKTTNVFEDLIRFLFKFVLGGTICLYICYFLIFLLSYGDDITQYLF